LTVPTVGTTIPHDVIGTSVVAYFVKPAEEGSGVAAGGAARALWNLPVLPM
jgi:small subunit ribosomal protein S5